MLLKTSSPTHQVSVFFTLSLVHGTRKKFTPNRCNDLRSLARNLLISCQERL